MRRGPRTVAVGALAGLLAAAMQHARADENVPVQWRCWYNNDTRLACRLGSAPPSSGSPAEMREALASAVRTGYSLSRARDGEPPKLVQVIQSMPEALRGRLVLIPLYTEPEDMDFAHELADAVVCGNRHPCVVLMTDSADLLARE